MCSSYPSGFNHNCSEIFLILARWGVRVPQNLFFFFFTFFFLVKHSKRGKMDKYIIIKLQVTSQVQLFPKLVATQLPLLN